MPPKAPAGAVLLRQRRIRVLCQGAATPGPELFWTGDTFTNDWTGTGWGTFTLDDLSAGNHQVNLDVNTAPGPGSTYYLNETRNNGGQDDALGARSGIYLRHAHPATGARPAVRSGSAAAPRG